LTAGEDPGDLALAIGAILLKGFLEAAETSLVSARRPRLSQLQEEGNKRAARALRLLDDPGRFTTSIDRTGEAAGIVGGVAAWSLFRSLLGTVMPSGYAGALGVGCFILLFFLLGNMVPKSLAATNPEWLAMASAAWVDRLAYVVYPVVRSFGALAKRVGKAAGRGDAVPPPYVTEEEIKIFAEQGVEAGELEEQEKEMIHSIFEFTDTVVREVMVPRIDIVAVDVEASLDEVLQAILTGGHSRIPVYEGSIDNIIGILHARDVLAAACSETREELNLRELREAGKLRPPYLIPENKRVSELLREFRQRKTPIAIVVDEYGGTAGLVTIEDLLEEIVGEIMDEWDVEEQMVQPLPDGAFLFDARAPIEDVNEALGTALPHDEFETLGGFVFGLFGRLPAEGESITYQGLQLTVAKADRHRITQIRVVKTEPPAPSAPEPATRAPEEATQGR
jgi:CBS domain containing-hemolysin-like protein